MRLNSEHLNKIPLKTVKSLIFQQFTAGTETFAAWQPTCLIESESTLKHDYTYTVDYGIEHVWKCFSDVEPTNSWVGKLFTFGAIHDEQADRLFLMGEKFIGTREGQTLMVECNLLGGLINIPVAWRFIKVDKPNWRFHFCYLEGGKTRGSHFLQLTETKNGTQVSHSTVYQGDNVFRDKYIYPIFHTALLKEFHENVRAFMAEQAN